MRLAVILVAALIAGTVVASPVVTDDVMNNGMLRIAAYRWCKSESPYLYQRSLEIYDTLITADMDLFLDHAQTITKATDAYKAFSFMRPTCATHERVERQEPFSL